jgi:hypothetical protein
MRAPRHYGKGIDRAVADPCKSGALAWCRRDSASGRPAVTAKREWGGIEYLRIWLSGYLVIWLLGVTLSRQITK